MSHADSRRDLLGQRDRLVAALRRCGNVMRGSLVQVRVRCGQRRCVCGRGGPRHPKEHLTVKLHGKTRTLYVNRDRRAEVQAWLEGYRHLRRLVEKLTEVNLQLLRSAKSGAAKERRAGRTRRS